MGLQITNSTVYLTIQAGKISKRVTEPAGSSKARTLDTGKVIHEELYDSITGKLTGIYTREGKYGKELHIAIIDDVKYDLQLKLSSGPASSFLRAIENVNLDKPVTIIPKVQEVNGIKRTSIIMSQDNTGVKWKYTKDAPGDLPPMKKIKVKGQEQWDDTDQLEFFERLINKINDQLKPDATMSIGADDDAPF